MHEVLGLDYAHHMLDEMLKKKKTNDCISNLMLSIMWGFNVFILSMISNTWEHKNCVVHIRSCLGIHEKKTHNS